MHGDLVIAPEAEREVKLLKTLAVLYVMDDPGHLARQDRQRDRIFRVFDYLMLSAPGSLDPMYRHWFAEADTAAARTRVVVDQDVTAEFEQYIVDAWPKALARLKALCEAG